VLFGAALYIFFGFRPVFWDMETQLFAAGLIIWTILSVVTAVKNINRKLNEINKRNLEEKQKRRREKLEREYYRTQADYEREEYKAYRRILKEKRRERFNDYFFDESVYK
jgi:hypothetical protein